MKRSAFLAALLFASCATQPKVDPSMHAPSAAAATASPSSQPCTAASVATLNAALWMQTSAEHEAVLSGIYSAARQQLDMAIHDPAWSAIDTAAMDPDHPRPPAIVLDLDETAIDTSASTARLLKKGTTYTEADWNSFALAGNSRALAPALAFLQTASARGVAIFYITNRIAEHEPALRRNLQALGFPLSDQAGDDTVLTRGERPEWATGDKSPRRAFVAQRYRVIMMFGDDLNDFAPAAGKSLADRNDIVRSHASWWGSRWFALPNPMYGSWERAVTGDAKGDCAQLQRKFDMLRTDEEYTPTSRALDRAVSPSADGPELERVLTTALQALPPVGTLVAGRDLDPAAREAIASVRKLISLDQLPQSETASLPAGYVRLDRLEMVGDTANVTLWYGPVPKARKGEILMDCGTGHRLALQRGADGAWKVTSRGMTVC